MNIKQIYEYYCFGYNYRGLFRGMPSSKILDVIKSIDEFLEFVEEHDLKVTRNVSFSDLKEMKNKLEEYEPDSVITSKISNKLSKIIKGIDRTLDGELKLRNAYILTEKRVGLERLLNKIDGMFSSGVFSNLPDIVKYDFSEAGKCISFERPTAAAFHILRGTEGALKLYYKSVVKRKRLEKPTWGPMVKELKGRKNTSKPLLDALDNIRSNYRNPTIHPYAKYNLDEAQDLFSVCADIVNKIIKSIVNGNIIF